MSVSSDIAAATAAANAATSINTFQWHGDQNTECGHWYAQIQNYNTLSPTIVDQIWVLITSMQQANEQVGLTISQIADVQAQIDKITAPNGVLWQIEQSINAAHDLFRDPNLTPSQINQLKAGLKSMESKMAEVQSQLRGYQDQLKQYQDTLNKQKDALAADDKKLTDFTAQLTAMTKNANDVLNQYVTKCGLPVTSSSSSSGVSGSSAISGSSGAQSSSGVSGVSGLLPSGASGVSGVRN
jgi:uncharacterized phage infection (PIP) family protein YhgE